MFRFRLLRGGEDVVSVGGFSQEWSGVECSGVQWSAVCLGLGLGLGRDGW